jgi:hypothetical protein
LVKDLRFKLYGAVLGVKDIGYKVSRVVSGSGSRVEELVLGFGG